ncbi:MAG: penicillin-binding protein activator [Gammaproteobacteria bacterium]|nr:MAG: penicillin-binding protein activator [Gammaproteobacteria bacterium]
MPRLLTILAVLLLALYGNPAAIAIEMEEASQPEIVSGPVIVSHIALLLPLESTSFAEAANAVKEGFETAAQRGQSLSLTIRLYSTSDDPLDIMMNYHHAVISGAAFVVGPLTRDGVSAIASSQSLAVPTLTLNTTDSHHTLPAKLYLFGLQTDSEAGQIAKLALASGRNHAVIIGDDSALSKRLQNAFKQRWQSEHEKTAEALRYSENPLVLQKLRDMTTGSERLAFLALDAAKSRIVRAYLDPEAPVYATSQIFTGIDNLLLNSDLNGIQFLDMPWLLQPDHPAVMAYRHTGKTRNTEMERLYALGIDAFRLMTKLLQQQSANDIALDGVTGNIRFAPPSLFIREPIAAQFDNGKVRLLTPPANTPENEGQ